jgi:Spy/CpxP family protein refolding chaperone
MQMKRILMTLLIVMGIATAIYAQRGMNDRMGQRPDRSAILKESLNVTDAQISAIDALNTTRRTRGEAIFKDIAAKRTALHELLNATSPNATAVGNAAIALHASQNQMKAERDWYLAELKKLLTGDQQVKLDELLAAQQRSPVLGALGLGGPGGRGGPGGPGGFGGRGPRG